MTERSWRTNVAPVRQLPRLEASNRWSSTDRDEEPARTPRLEFVSARGRRSWDAVVGLLTVAAVGLALVKPWAGPSAVGNEGTPVPVTAAAAAPGVASSFGPVNLPAAVFAPPAADCLSDMGWRACAVDRSGAHMVRSLFGPARPLAAEGLEAPVSPAVALVTKGGAALAFYAPPGFYAAEDRKADGAGGEPAWGPVAVSAWRIDAGPGGTRWIELSPLGSLGAGVAAGNEQAGGPAVGTDPGAAGSDPQARGVGPRGITDTPMAANVFVASADPLLEGERWPAGRYVVWFQGGGAQPWDAFFDFEILPAPPSP